MSTIANAYRELDHYARQHYGITGDVLLAKLEKGESGGSGTAKSNAGARGWFQFIAPTRQAVVQKFGIDPWRSEHEARDAAVLHLTGKLGNAPGLEGYNPGGGKAYVRYILGQKVGHVTPTRIPGSAPSVGGVSGTGVNPTQPFSPGSGSQALAALLSAATGPQHTPPPVTLAPPPAFAASAAMPAGYQAPEAGAPPAPKPTIDPAQLQALTDLTLPKIRQPTAGGGAGGGFAAPGARVRGAVGGSPIPGLRPHAATHQTSGLAGYPAFDYMANAGTAVVAPVSGRIVKLSGSDPRNGPSQGPHGPFGYSIYVQGNDGRTYYLTHLGSRNVRVGQRVRRGTQIGTVGNYAKWGGANHVHMGVHG
jgi:murein DD-endopeptidase MepM/ murein hydrolase activator NlpD